MTAAYPCDLHCHTTRSDGCDTPRELISNAAALGLKIIAITDHDVPPPETVEVNGTQIPVAAYAALKGISVLRGSEISCETEVEDVHLVVLGCDWGDPFFAQLEAQVQRSKIDSYRKLIELIHEDGYNITWGDVLYNGGNPILPEQTQKKLIFERLAQIGFAESWSAAKLRCKQTERYCVMRPKPNPIDVISEAHRCGGIAILAHPFLIAEPVAVDGNALTRSAYIERLIAAGLDGIEARYTYDKTSYSGDLAPDEIEQLVCSQYGERLEIISAGSDYHADHKKGVQDARKLGERGLTLEEFSSFGRLREIAKSEMSAVRSRCAIG